MFLFFVSRYEFIIPTAIDYSDVRFETRGRLYVRGRGVVNPPIRSQCRVSVLLPNGCSEAQRLRESVRFHLCFLGGHF